MPEFGPHCHPAGIRGVGPNGHVDIMIVSVAPAVEEMKSGEPFVGPAGKLLNAILRTVGLKREDCYLTNCCCGSWGHELKSPEEFYECIPRLAQEIEQRTPKLIITLGSMAAQVMSASWGLRMENQQWPHMIAEGKNLGALQGAPLVYQSVVGSAHSCRIMATSQPAAYLYEGGAAVIVSLVRDFQKLMPAPMGQDVLSWEPDHGKFEWNLVESSGALDIVLSCLQVNVPVAIDIETGSSDNLDDMSMDVFVDSMLCFAISQDGPIGTISWTVPPEYFQQFAEWFKLNGSQYQWLMHYGFFDLQGIRKFLSIDMVLARDTLIESYSLDERQGVHGLKPLSREYTGAGFWEEPVKRAITLWQERQKRIAKIREQDAWAELGVTDQEIADETFDCDHLIDLFPAHKSRRTMEPPFLDAYNSRLEAIKVVNYGIVPKALLYRYNGEDAARTAQLDAVLSPMLTWDDVGRVNDLLVEDTNVNADIAYEGIKIDQVYHKALMNNWEPKAQAMRERLQKAAEEEGWVNEDGTQLNLGSPKQKSEFIWGMLGVTPPASKKLLTKTGQRSTSIKLIAQIKSQSSWLEEYVAYVHLIHTLQSYGRPIPRFIRDDDHLHAMWKPHGARTLRDAYAKPPLHQIPEHVEEDEEWLKFVGAEYGLKNMFVTDDPDKYIWVHADFERSEFYCMAYLSGDANLLADCQSFDQHRRTYALYIGHIPEEDVTSKQRRDAKFVNFGISFGMGKDSLAKEHLHCSVYEAGKMLDAWMDGHPDYVRYMKERKIEAMQTGEIVVKQTGAKRRFRLIMGEASFHELNEAVNMPPQNLSAVNMKKSRIALHPLLKPLNSRILLTTHDSLDFQISREHYQEALDVIHREMTASHFENIPGIPISIEAGPSWGELHHVKKFNVAGQEIRGHQPGTWLEAKEDKKTHEWSIAV